MITLTFLGTGCMQPTKQRNHAGVLFQYKEENILFDCGEGIQRQMRIAGIKPAKITRLCISHWHGDHVFGIPGLLSSMGADQYAQKLYIYGPRGSKAYFEHMVRFFAAKDLIPFQVEEISSGIVCETDEFLIRAEPLKHSTPCVGYRFEEKERRRIDLRKAKKIGLVEGPLMGQVQRGKEVLIQGKKVTPEEVTYVVPGTSASYITDTMDCTGARILAKDVDLLIMEGTLLDNLKANAVKSKHLTVKQSALIASESNARKLVITHLSQRYKNSNEIMEEAQQYFQDVIVAEDFLKLKL